MFANYDDGPPDWVWSVASIPANFSDRFPDGMPTVGDYERTEGLFWKIDASLESGLKSLNILRALSLCRTPYRVRQRDHSKLTRPQSCDYISTTLLTT